MKTKTLVWIGIYAVVGYGAYYFIFSKRAYANKIISSGKYTSSVDNLLSFDKGFLKQWAKAATRDEVVFTYNGVVYNTLGGRAKK